MASDSNHADALAARRLYELELQRFLQSQAVPAFIKALLIPANESFRVANLSALQPIQSQTKLSVE